MRVDSDRLKKSEMGWTGVSRIFLWQGSLVELRVLVLHVPLQVKLFELGESAEAEEADDLPPEVVAEVPLRPNPLEGPAVADAVRYRLKHAVDHVVGIGTGDRVRRLNFCSLFSVRSP